MPVIPATQEAEAGELPAGGGGCGELRSRHCTPAWVTRAKLHLKKKKNKKTLTLILTLNVNGLNAPIKRHRLANRIKSQNPSVCCIQETHLTCKDTQRLRIKGWRKIYQANGEQKKAGVAIPVSDKIDFKPTKIKRDKEGHYIMVKGSMQQES